jgi:E3 ubiquitin-protein ligase XIAP/baculoviral IAP repeat-containing protein 7/8
VHGLQEAIEAKQCVVCLDADACVLLKPCGHMCLCQGCGSGYNSSSSSSSSSSSVCPLCQAPVTHTERVFT